VAANLNVEVKDSAIDPDDTARVIRVRNQDTDRPLYQVFLYLDGPDLPFVDSVTYHLHPTFPTPERRVTRSVTNPRCKLAIWAWGLFEVKVIIRDKTGREEMRVHGLEYDRQFSEKDVKFLPS